MRICQIVSHVDEEASGPSYSVPRLSQSLAGLGHDVVLATLQARGWRPHFDWIEHVEFASSGWPARLGRSSQMSEWLTRRAADFDIIHSHGLWMMPNIYPAEAARAARRIYVVSPRGTLSAAALKYSSHVKKVFWAVAQRSALVSAAAFHATSEDELTDIRRAGFRQPVAIIPNGIDGASVGKEGRAQPQARDRRTLLYLGRIHPKKGLDLALPAWRAVQDQYRQWTFRIVGRGDASYIESLRRLACEIGVERVTFEDAIYGDAKREAMRSADLFVLPTRNENFGMVVAEALAESTPVLTTKGAPWEGLIAHGCGWWCDVGVAPIAAALNQALVLDASTLHGMGRNGAAWMASAFSWKAIGANTADFYTWLLGGKPTPPCVRVY